MKDIIEQLMELNRQQQEILFQSGFLLPDGAADKVCDSLELTYELLAQLMPRD